MCFSNREGYAINHLVLFPIIIIIIIIILLWIFEIPFFFYISPDIKNYLFDTWPLDLTSPKAIMKQCKEG